MPPARHEARRVRVPALARQPLRVVAALGDGTKLVLDGSRPRWRSVHCVSSAISTAFDVSRRWRGALAGPHLRSCPLCQRTFARPAAWEILRAALRALRSVRASLGLSQFWLGVRSQPAASRPWPII